MPRPINPCRRLPFPTTYEVHTAQWRLLRRVWRVAFPFIR
jgi:hypothetical protein